MATVVIAQKAATLPYGNVLENWPLAVSLPCWLSVALSLCLSLLRECGHWWQATHNKGGKQQQQQHMAN